jgi:similar to spore coat protein
MRKNKFNKILGGKTMEQKYLGLNETIQVHEILNLKTICMTTAKSGVRNYAIAITEKTNIEVRNVLRKQLKDAIATHEKNFGIYDGKGLLSKEQFKVYMLEAETALKLTEELM